MKKLLFVLLAIMLSLQLGCAVSIYPKNPKDAHRISTLQQEVEALNSKLAGLSKARSEEIKKLEPARDLLQKSLVSEISEKKVKLEVGSRGLVITFVAEVLFDSGKTELREEAFEVLNKVADVLKVNLTDRSIAVEGHTDNEPIKHSGWKSNWELSTARATSVLHYLVDEKSLPPKKIAATGYGEYRPIASNDIKEGQQQNRRVEIVLLPKDVSKIELETLDELKKKEAELEQLKRDIK